MRSYLPVTLMVLGLIGCQSFQDITALPFNEQLVDGGKCPASTDLATVPTPAPCPAARGLTGDNLLCVDFASPQTTLADLMNKGWKFDEVKSGNCGGWQIANNLLQVSNFSMLNGVCGLALPLVTTLQIQKYSRLTLSIQQRIDLNDPQQKAQIFLNDGTDTQNLMWQSSGKKYVPRQQTVLTVDTADLPTLLKSGGFKWFFQVSSPAGFPLNGWQFESIAINASS